MRLLNVHDLTFVEFYDEERPKYAILSHTWTTDEASYADWLGGLASLGREKILSFCQLVRRFYDLDWAWVDTCCINKDSSAELSEAINSMYAWYGGASVCIAYLADVDADQSSPTPWKTQLRTSRWFTRGWTLQELIAPKIMIFTDSHWAIIGSKDDIAGELSDITGISVFVLRARDGREWDLSELSIAERMSWAAKRVTTRKEDTAYCLLGIFGVNMSLLYGEGDQAFIRLQRKLIKRNYDESILLWTPKVPVDDPQFYSSKSVHSVTGLLAKHPSDFGSSRWRIGPAYTPPAMPMEVQSRGIAIKVYNSYLHSILPGEQLVLPTDTYALVEKSGVTEWCKVGVPIVQFNHVFYRDLTRDFQYLPSDSGDRIFPRTNAIWNTMYISDVGPQGLQSATASYYTKRPSQQALIRFADQSLDATSLIASLDTDQLRMVRLEGLGDHFFDRVIAAAKVLNDEDEQRSQNLAESSGCVLEVNGNSSLDPRFNFDFNWAAALLGFRCRWRRDGSS